MGILEEINGKLDRIMAFLANNANTATPAAVAQPAVQQPVAADPFGGLGGTATPAAAVPANVTAEQIMALITPVIGNEAIKAKLGEALKAMGVDNLNNLQPGQYADAYGRFQAIINAAGGGAATGGGASII